MTSSNEFLQFERAVLAADDARYAAMLAGDLSALEQRLAGQLSYVHSTGYMEDRLGYLAGVRAGKVRYLNAQRGQTTVERLSETVALMRGDVTLSIHTAGQDKVMNNLFLSIWVLHDGGWQMQAWTSVPRAQPSAG